MNSSILILKIAVLFSIITIYIRQKKHRKIEFENKLNKKNVTLKKNEIEIDSAIDFGYKMQWFAVKTNDKIKIAEIFKLENLSESNWELGIIKAYDSFVFITPQINDWTLVCDNGFLFGGSELTDILELLSKEFGEAQFFATHRVSEYHCWMKAIDGHLTRSFTYSDEYEDFFKAEGEPTEIEKKYKLQHTGDNLEDLDSIDELTVMEIANNWSVNPTEISERKDIQNELGIIGSFDRNNQ